MSLSLTHARTSVILVLSNGYCGQGQNSMAGSRATRSMNLPIFAPTNLLFSMLAHLFSARENTEGTNTGSCQFVFSDVELSAMPSQVLGPVCRRRSRFYLVARGRAADMAVADSGRFRNLPPSKPNWHLEIREIPALLINLRLGSCKWKVPSKLK